MISHEQNFTNEHLKVCLYEKLKMRKLKFISTTIQAVIYYHATTIGYEEKIGYMVCTAFNLIVGRFNSNLNTSVRARIDVSERRVHSNLNSENVHHRRSSAKRLLQAYITSTWETKYTKRHANNYYLTTNCKRMTLIKTMDFYVS